MLWLMAAGNNDGHLLRNYHKENLTEFSKDVVIKIYSQLHEMSL